MVDTSAIVRPCLFFLLVYTSMVCSSVLVGITFMVEFSEAGDILISANHVINQPPIAWEP